MPLLLLLCAELNECDVFPCDPFGDCVDLVNDYRCICRPGFTATLNPKQCDGNESALYLNCRSKQDAVGAGRFRSQCRHLTNCTILAHTLHCIKTITSSIKPEVHRILHCRWSRTEQRRHVYRKFGETGLCERTNRHRHAHCTPVCMDEVNEH